MTQSECKFFIPGPTWVRPEILQEMTRPMIGHRSSEFKALFRRIVTDLHELFVTRAAVFVATCSGTGVMEAALENCVPRRVLVTTCGAFSERWYKIAQTLGLEADRLEEPWGQAIDPLRLADHLASRRAHYDAVTLTHNETSTGITNDVQTLARIIHDESPGTLILVDAVSSLAGIPVSFDDWGLDVCLASVQKGIALPPGITVFAVSDAALDAAGKRKYRGTYFDFLEYKKQAEDDAVPSTPSIPHFHALARQLDDILRKETLAARFERHRAMRDLTIERTAGYATVAGDREHASPTVTALRPVTGSAEDVRSAMKARGYTLGAGYGEWKETTFRIGHMGDITIEAVSGMLDVLDELCHPERSEGSPSQEP
ncbi:MAG TPA: alanine--glyoxylate aminotransferase family protein [Thermoanaerobaculia bacterium]|nr:alanine--glyoxylate aminotransferase family protein [Thermoanaerobaculia bacterium]